MSSVSESAEVLEDELRPQLLRLTVPLLGPLLHAVGRLQGVGPLQGPGVQARLQGGVVEDAAGQKDGCAPLGGILHTGKKTHPVGLAETHIECEGSLQRDNCFVFLMISLFIPL